jgi:hypothetical protein
MPWVTTRDILNRLRSFHSELADIYSRSHRTVKDEKAKLLLRLMVEQEEQIQESMKEYESKFSPEVLDTWVQFFPAKSLDDILAAVRVRMTPEMEMDDVLERALRADRAVAKIFHQLAGTTSAGRVQEFFEGLHDMEEAKSSEYSRSTLGTRSVFGRR